MKYTTALKRMITAAGFMVYLYFLTKLILFKWGSVDVQVLLNQLESTLNHPYHIFDRPGNYTPFKQILREIHSMSISNPLSSTNLIGNILAFIPLGIFLPKLFSSSASSISKVFVLSLSLSLCFEMTQLLLFIGTFDVDDLILNTSGAMLGYAALRIQVSSVKHLAVK